MFSLNWHRDGETSTCDKKRCYMLMEIIDPLKYFWWPKQYAFPELGVLLEPMSRATRSVAQKCSLLSYYWMKIYPFWWWAGWSRSSQTTGPRVLVGPIRGGLGQWRERRGGEGASSAAGLRGGACVHSIVLLSSTDEYHVLLLLSMICILGYATGQGAQPRLTPRAQFQRSTHKIFHT